MKLLLKLLWPWLIEYQWYRKRMGGKWYRVKDEDVSAFSAPMDYWVRILREGDTVIETEDYG